MPSQISIHALLAESDGGSVAGNWRLAIFLSTLSLRRATWKRFPPMCTINHFYPRSPCGERPRAVFLSCNYPLISIHALLAESDKCSLSNPRKKPYFYPRSPCGERRPAGGRTNSTPDFYPRSPCGERPVMHNIVFMPREFLSTLSLRRATINTYHRIFGGGISIHALLAESDLRKVPLLGIK